MKLAMNLHQNLDIKRLTLLMRNELLINKQAIIMFMTSLTALLFLFGIIFPAGAAGNNFHVGLYWLLLFVGGFWCSSRAFKELHEPTKNTIFLTLPASNLEKFLSKLLLMTVGYVLATLVFYFLLSLLVVGAGKLISPNMPQHLFNPFNQPFFILKSCGVYIVLQSVFLLGSVYFNKHVLPKTILALSIIALIFSLFSLVLVGIIFNGHQVMLSTMFTNVINTVFWIALAPCCWIVSFLRLRETEI